MTGLGWAILAGVYAYGVFVLGHWLGERQGRHEGYDAGYKAALKYTVFADGEEQK